ncbi:MAG: AAA family ATPase [Proteobacteria bacterium]|nr:AAA family ATPase [Pseudomonadota bacterium]
MPENVTDGLSSSDRDIVEIEQTLSRSVIKAILESTPDSSIEQSQYDHFYQLRDEIITAKTEDLPTLFNQLHLAKSTLQIDRQTDLPDLQQPYFAHMRLQTTDKVQDILLGYRTFVDSRNKVTIIDWRNAPLSKIFFLYQEGEEYEEEINGRTMEGLMSMRHILSFDNGQLVEIATANGVLRRTLERPWERMDTSFAPILSGGGGNTVARQIIGTGHTGYRSPVVSALLDREQFEILTEDEAKPILILGGAGSGKTTAALHRLALLAFKKPRHFRPDKMLVVVPEKGLVKLTKLLLGELGISNITVCSFTDWVKKQARNLIAGLPDRICEESPYPIVRLKKHPALLQLLPRYLKKVEKDIVSRINRRFPGDPKLAKDFSNHPDRPLLKRLLDAKESALTRTKKQGVKPTSQKAQWITEFFDGEIELLYDLNGDRLALFTDKELLTELAPLVKNDTDKETVLDVIRRTSLQHLPTSAERYRGYDREKLVMADGQSILDGDSDELAGSIDQEDFAILLELLHLKVGEYRVAKKSLPTYTHLVVDETQDFAPIELSLLKETITQDTTVTVAGDSMQQIDPTAYFEGWQSSLERLGIADTAPVQLKTIYRSPKPIADFAHDILGSIAPPERPNAVKDGVPVSLSHYPNEGLAASALVGALENLTQKEPLASIAIIARNAKQAKNLYWNLNDLLNVKLVLDGEFSFSQGTEITDVSQVKGLEFDYVIVPEANAKNYPDTLESRRLLHVAATRAIHQLWLFWTGEKSAVIPNPSADIG